MCALDALNAAAPRARQYDKAKGMLQKAIGERQFIGVWNDRSTHAEVMAKFDEAIAACPDDGEEAE